MKIDVECCICHVLFERERGELKRNAKLGRKIYCSKQCSGKDGYSHFIPSPKGIIPAPLLGLANNRWDNLSPFRQHLKNIRARGKTKNKEVLVTLLDLKSQWELQEGVCPYTGWYLDNPKSTTSKGLSRHPVRASVDRIDSNKGYTKDNIHFISLIAQYAKNKFSECDLLNFCKDVVKYKSNKSEGHIKLEDFKSDDFKYYINNIKKHKKEYDITLADLSEQWITQSGTCPYTGWKLLNISGNERLYNNDATKLISASLDRIDSSKIYTKSNIQFVSLMSQYAKNSFPEDELYTFCNSVVSYRKLEVQSL